MPLRQRVSARWRRAPRRPPAAALLRRFGSWTAQQASHTEHPVWDCERGAGADEGVGMWVPHITRSFCLHCGLRNSVPEVCPRPRACHRDTIYVCVPHTRTGEPLTHSIYPAKTIPQTHPANTHPTWSVACMSISVPRASMRLPTSSLPASAFDAAAPSSTRPLLLTAAPGSPSLRSRSAPSDQMLSSCGVVLACCLRRTG